MSLQATARTWAPRGATLTGTRRGSKSRDRAFANIVWPDIFMFSMPDRRILQLGDPMLRAVSVPVPVPREAEAVFQDLHDTLDDFRSVHGFGRGISAVQIGVPKRLIYIELDGRAYRLRNPEYMWQSPEKFRLWDDCFCFPALLVWVERSQEVRIRYQDEAGSEQVLEASGPFSELLQHEMDHLDGILAVDRAIDRVSLCTRQEWQRRYGAKAPLPTDTAQ